MDTRYRSFARHSARGAVKPITVAIIAIVGALAVASWFLIFKPHEDLVAIDAGSHPSTPVTVAHQAAPPVNVEAMSLNDLLAEARKAMNDQRLVTPAGNNAFEFYLKVLEKQPGNQVAADALREQFPFAATTTEQTINQRDFSEAQRQIDLLAKVDPTNYTVTILRSKLDAQRKTLDQEQQKQLDQQHQEQLAAQKAVVDKATADKAAADKAAVDKAAQDQAALAAQQKAKQEQAAQQTAATAVPKQEQAVDTSTAGGETRDAILAKQYPLRYPPTAQRSRQEGWVDLQFTVDTAGNVDGVQVLDSKPRHVFDSAAVESVRRWKFSPAMHNGTAVATQQHQRIVFQLTNAQ